MSCQTWKYSHWSCALSAIQPAPRAETCSLALDASNKMRPLSRETSLCRNWNNSTPNMCRSKICPISTSKVPLNNHSLIKTISRSIKPWNAWPFAIRAGWSSIISAASVNLNAIPVYKGGPWSRVTGHVSRNALLTPPLSTLLNRCVYKSFLSKVLPILYYINFILLFYLLQI